MREHPIRAALVAAVVGAAYITAAATQGHTAEAARVAEFERYAAAVDGEASDTLTVLTSKATFTYTGDIDVFSTSIRRVDFGAIEGAEFAGIPLPCHRGRCAMGGGYDVTVSGPEPFAGTDCVFYRLDAMAGYSHVYMLCDF